MNAEQIIADAQNEWRSPKPGLDPCTTEAEHIAHRLRKAGIDLDHTYADTGINTLNGASMTLGHIERNEPLYVRRPLEDQ